MIVQTRKRQCRRPARCRGGLPAVGEHPSFKISPSCYSQRMSATDISEKTSKERRNRPNRGESSDSDDGAQADVMQAIQQWQEQAGEAVRNAAKATDDY